MHDCVMTTATHEACVIDLLGARGVDHCKSGLHTHIVAVAFPQGISAAL